MKTETEKRRSEIYNNLSTFLDEKGFSFSEKMRVRRVVTMLAELNNSRTIQFDYKNNCWEIKGKNNFFYSRGEAELFDVLERIFYPEEVNSLYVNEKLTTIVRMLYKLFDYGEEAWKFNKK